MTVSPITRAVDNLNVMAGIAKPKPVKTPKHKHCWRRGANSICLICGKKRPSKPERTVLEKELWDKTALYVKNRDGWKCITCGSEKNPTMSHWIKAGKQIVRYDLRNVACQCSSCNNRNNYYTYFYDNWMNKTYGEKVMQELRQTVIDCDKRNGKRTFRWEVVELKEMIADIIVKLEEQESEAK